MSKLIYLTKGRTSTVDDDNYELLNKYKWYAIQGKYAARDKRINGKRFHIRMSRHIMDCPANMEVDHINGNTLDNRRENLRVVTHSINGKNTHSYKKESRSSKYRGVYYNNEIGRVKRWTAQITINMQHKFIGRFLTETDAAIAYNKEAEKHGFIFINGVTNE